VDTVPATGPRPWLVVGNEVGSLLATVDDDEFDRALELLRDPARTWFFTGQGRSGLVASMVAMRFMHLGRRVHVQGEVTAPAIRANDGLLVVSGSGVTPVSLHFAEIAKAEGAVLAVVTHEPHSRIADMADAVLTLPARRTVQFGGSLFEQTALLLLDALVLAIAARTSVPYESMSCRHTNLQ